MTATRPSRLLQFTGLLLSALVWLANNGNPPTGRTGAPFDGHCNSCHDGTNPGGFDGDVTISGLPATIQPNTVYPLTITMNVTAGSPVLGGFQMVVVDNNNADAGDLKNLAVNPTTGTEMLGTREYIEHRNGKSLTSGSASWDFEWESPASVAGNNVKFYFIGNFTNDNNNDTGDFPKAFLETVPFAAPPPVTATIVSSTNVLCNGGNTGSATVEGGGGIEPYTYLWSNGQTTATANNLVANTYTVTVTGASGSGTATASVVITQPSAVAVTTSVSGSLSCSTTSVTASASASGGTPGYDYAWSNGEIGPNAMIDQPGTYTVIASDANGCTKIGSVTVTENITAPTAVVATGGTITCTTTQLQLSGAGSSQGGNFTYLWTASAGGNIVSGANTLTPTVNACGNYTLTVTNTSNGCTAAASTSVDCQIDAPDISVSNDGPLTCTKLSVTLSGNSNTPGVTYAWTGPGNFSSAMQNPVVNAPGMYTLVVSNPENSCTSSAVTMVAQNIVAPTDTANVSGILTCVLDSVAIFANTNIGNATYAWTGPNGFVSTQKRDTITAPGDYIAVVTNPANGCKSRDTITVVQNITVPGATASATGSITCNNGSVQLNGGPSGALTYAWTGPDNYNSTEQNPVVTTAGTYTLVVTNPVNGCTSAAGVTAVQNTTEPTAAIAAPANLNCNNTTVQLDGTASSQGNNFTYLWTTNDGNIESGSNTLTPVVSAAGTYTLLVTNTENACSATASATVVQSSAVNAFIISGTSIACFGGATGAAEVQGTGGTGNFTYLWSNGATTPVISGLIAGTYIAIVTDSDGCTATASAVVIQPAAALQTNATATGETALGANDGTATATPTGGTPPYSYNWSNGGTTAAISGLAPGSYTVVVTDFYLCTAEQTVTVNVFGCNLSATISSTNLNCNGVNDGTAAVAFTGATDPVTFSWSNEATTQQVTGLAPGTYTVSITDASNCAIVLSATISEPPAVSANASATGETASGANDGTATATPTGGTGIYIYEWSTGDFSASISGLAPGTYTVSVTDSNNCQAAQQVTVNAFNCALAVTTSQADVSCFGGADGLATVVATNGQLPYNYTWSTGGNTATVGNLSAGVYSVVATDGAGCSATVTVTITAPDALVAEATNIQNVVCAGDFTGSAAITATGGVAPYLVTGNLNNLAAGTYTVVVTDANGCTTNVSFTINAVDAQPPVVSCPATILFCGADFVSYPAPTATDNCGSVSTPVLISGKPSGSVFNDGTTVQVFRATDAAGNTGTCSFAVVVYPIPDILFDGSSDDSNGAGVGTISVTPVGGTGPYLYAWNRNGQAFSNDEDLSGLNAGSYTLTITDANGCTSALSPVVIGNTVGTNNLETGGAIRLFPNPASFSLQLEIVDITVASAIILDTRGRLVYTLQPGEWQQEIALDQLSTGVYFMRIATENGKVITLKFVKSE